MAIHHNVLAKAQRNGIEIKDLGNTFECWIGDTKVSSGDNAREALAEAIVVKFERNPKKEDDVAKTVKKASKKAAKKVAKTNGGKIAKTIVSDDYRKNYNADDNCGDKIAKAITEYVKNGKVLDMDKLQKLADDNSVDMKPWKDLNNGQKSMNLRNVLRARHKKGEKVKIAGRVFE